MQSSRPGVEQILDAHPADLVEVHAAGDRVEPSPEGWLGLQREGPRGAVAHPRNRRGLASFQHWSGHAQHISVVLTITAISFLASATCPSSYTVCRPPSHSCRSPPYHPRPQCQRNERDRHSGQQQVDVGVTVAPYRLSNCTDRRPGRKCRASRNNERGDQQQAWVLRLIPANRDRRRPLMRPALDLFPLGSAALNTHGAHENASVLGRPYFSST